MELATRKHYCCGDHYVVCRDGRIDMFHIFADCYDDFQYTFLPNQFNQVEYHRHKMQALLSFTTIFEG